MCAVPKCGAADSSCCAEVQSGLLSRIQRQDRRLPPLGTWIGVMFAMPELSQRTVPSPS
jgi:hypothetical protein